MSRQSLIELEDRSGTLQDFDTNQGAGRVCCLSAQVPGGEASGCSELVCANIPSINLRSSLYP